HENSKLKNSKLKTSACGNQNFLLLTSGFTRPTYLAVHPPSTKSALPVMNDDASEARKTTVPASSCGSPQRPIGICATNSLYLTGSSSRVRLSSVPNGPGQMALAV